MRHLVQLLDLEQDKGSCKKMFCANGQAIKALPPPPPPRV